MLRAQSLLPNLPQETLEFACDLVLEQICNYCNLTEAPDGLTNTAALMVRGLVNSVQLQNENMQPAAKGVSRGDTSFSFATAAEQLAALSYGYQDISQWAGSGQNQSQELNGFWIDSSLKISPVEQVQVLAEIFQGESPYTPEEVATLQKIMLVQDQGEQQVYGKTGTGFGETGWFHPGEWTEDLFCGIFER